jgi:hypothetical protein
VGEYFIDHALVQILDPRYGKASVLLRASEHVVRHDGVSFR